VNSAPVKFEALKSAPEKVEFCMREVAKSDLYNSASKKIVRYIEDAINEAPDSSA